MGRAVQRSKGACGDGCPNHQATRSVRDSGEGSQCRHKPENYDCSSLTIMRSSEKGCDRCSAPTAVRGRRRSRRRPDGRQRRRKSQSRCRRHGRLASGPQRRATGAAPEGSQPHIKTLALTVHEEGGYLRSLMDAGASGYVLKRSAASELLRAIEVVGEGGTYLDSSMAGQLVSKLRTAASRRRTERRAQRARTRGRAPRRAWLQQQGDRRKTRRQRQDGRDLSLSCDRQAWLAQPSRSRPLRRSIKAGWLTTESRTIVHEDITKDTKRKIRN